MNKKLCIFYLVILALANAQTDSCCRNYQIQVTGKGIASAQPDVAILNINFSEQGLTSAEAVKKLSNKVNQALATLKANGYGNDAYETGSLSVYPEYDYSVNPARETGQRAQQSITIRVRGLDEKGQKVATLIDALATKVNGLNINNVSFDIFDKTPLQTQARAAAFRDAKKKAEDYASFAGVSVGRVLTIDDFSYVEAPPVQLAFATAKMSVAADSVGTSVPVGEQDVTYSTTITFDLR